MASTALTVTIVTLLPVSCDDRFDPQASRVRQAGELKDKALKQAIDTAVGGLEVQALGHLDACEPGQDNWRTKDPCRWRCGVGYRAIAGCPLETHRQPSPPSTRAFSERGAARRRRWSSIGPGIAGLKLQSGGSLGPRGRYRCLGVEVDILLGRSDDNRLAEEIDGLPRGPFGRFLARQPLAGARALVSAQDAGHRFVLIADVSGDYHVEPR